MGRDTFSNEERDLLLNLLRERKAVFGDSTPSFEANTAKKQAWADLTKEFNAVSTTARTESQLRDFLKRLKTMARKEVANHRKIQQGTGGGPPPPNLPEWIDVLEEIFPWLTKEMVCRFDSDAQSTSTQSSLKEEAEAKAPKAPKSPKKTLTTTRKRLAPVADQLLDTAQLREKVLLQQLKNAELEEEVLKLKKRYVQAKIDSMDL